MSFSFPQELGQNLEPSDYILERYISVCGASVCTGYSIQYLRRLLRSGTLSGTKIGQVWLIDMNALERYFDLAKTRNDRRCGPRKPVNDNNAVGHLAEVLR